jgi:hypothetical protein
VYGCSAIDAIGIDGITFIVAAVDADINAATHLA